MNDDIYKLEPDPSPEDIKAIEDGLTDKRLGEVPAQVDMQYVLGKSADYIHTQGDMSMPGIIEANQPDWQQWPVRLHLDVILKQLLNTVGMLQAQMIELERKVEKMKNEGN
jgi:hypothetical protein